MASLMKSSPALGAPRLAGRKALQVQARLANKTSTKAAAYVCVDCGYLYDGKKGPFESLPGSYTCPVCGAGKKRFKPYKGNLKSNDNKTMSNRRDQLREQLEASGESVGEDASFLIVTAAGAAAFLAAVYYFTAVAR